MGQQLPAMALAAIICWTQTGMALDRGPGPSHVSKTNAAHLAASSAPSLSSLQTEGFSVTACPCVWSPAAKTTGSVR